MNRFLTLVAAFTVFALIGWILGTISNGIQP